MLSGGAPLKRNNEQFPQSCAVVVIFVFAVHMFQNERLRTEAQYVYLPPPEKYTKIGIFFEG